MQQKTKIPLAGCGLRAGWGCLLPGCELEVDLSSELEDSWVKRRGVLAEPCVSPRFWSTWLN